MTDGAATLMTGKDLVWKGGAFSIYDSRWQAPGFGRSTVHRTIVEHPSVVGMVAVRDGRMALVRQFRQIVGKEILELPAGRIEPSEHPEDAARRELQEEIGMRPGRLEQVAEFYASPGYTTERVHLFYCSMLEPLPLPADDEEHIEVMWVDFDEAAGLVATGGIEDAKSILGIYIVRALLGL